MKYNHRSEMLDANLDQNVRVTFKDREIVEGVLMWNEACKPPLFLRAGRYYIVQNNGVYYRIMKYQVKSVERLN